MSRNNVLCEYNVLFTELDNLEPDPKIEKRLRHEIGNYINIRLEEPIYVTGSYLCLVYMSEIEPGEPYFTRKSLATEILKTIEYIKTNPDTMPFNMSTLYFKNITYDHVRMMYVANISIKTN